jgi:hypothetical protein
VSSGFGWVVIAARSTEGDDALQELPGLALDAADSAAIVDDEVVAGVLAEGHENAVTGVSERDDDRQRRAVADILRMLHVVGIANTSDGSIARAPE